MVEHKRHEGGVVEVRYENGTSILINYTDQAVDVNGVLVEPQNYAVGVAGHENEIVPDSERSMLGLLFIAPWLIGFVFCLPDLCSSPSCSASVN